MKLAGFTLAGLALIAAVLVLIAAVYKSFDSSDPLISGDDSSTSNASTPNATVERVVDGDTIVVTVTGASGTHTVRLIGIDTPETVHPARPEECYGAEATSYIQTLLPEGTPITLVRDIEAHDGFERLLAYVYRSSDGLFVNSAMVASGHAAAYPYPPNRYHADHLARAEGEARAVGSGLWGACGGPDRPLH